MDVINWSKKIEELGAGEILLTSIDRDGTKDGYDILSKDAPKTIDEIEELMADAA